MLAAALAGVAVLLACGQAGGRAGADGTVSATGAPVTKGSKTSVGSRNAKSLPDWIQRRFIPFGPRRKRQMARYSLRHYGEQEWRLRQPRQIVQHVALAATAAQVFNSFRLDRPDPEFHELPASCAHFVVSGRGRVVQLVPVGIRCRHTVGLNHVAIGIEHTGFRDADVLDNRRQMRASVRLTRWLRCRYDIAIGDVIGHGESLGSRYFRELVPAMKNQTHGDFRHASMRRYRKALHDAGRCPR